MDEVATESRIHFESIAGVSYPKNFDKDQVQRWLIYTADREGKVIENLQYVLCNDPYLLDLNSRYLHHDTLTDIITFPYSNSPVNAEVYLSLDRIADNAEMYADGDVLSELHRVVVHGLLHMCGYQDSTDEMKAIMRDLESKYLLELESFAE